MRADLRSRRKIECDRICQKLALYLVITDYPISRRRLMEMGIRPKHAKLVASYLSNLTKKKSKLPMTKDAREVILAAAMAIDMIWKSYDVLWELIKEGRK